MIVTAGDSCLYHRAGCLTGIEIKEVVKSVGKPCAIIDCFIVLNDYQIRKYLELGCEVKGMGRGHIQRMKKEIIRKR